MVNRMNDEPRNIADVPYILHEAEMSRLERVIKRLWILCIIMFLALIGTNAGWIWYESQFQDVVVEQDVDTGEGDALVSGTGDVYGEGSSESTDEG